MTNKPLRILIVKLGAVGDVVHTLYALRALRLGFPEAEIGWVVEDKSVAVIRDHPDLDHLFIFMRRKTGGGFRALGDYIQIAKQIRGFKPDIAIDFQTLIKSGALTRLSGAKRRIGFDTWREGNFLFTNERIRPEDHEEHAVKKYFALLRSLGLHGSALVTQSIAENPVRIQVQQEHREKVDAFFQKSIRSNCKVVAVNPGASWPTKRWPAGKYGEVAGTLAENEDIVPVAIWGPGEEELAQEVVTASGGRARLAPKTTIRELAYLLERCDLYLGGDTGPMHIASIMGTPSVALFAPSDPARVHPWNVKHRILEPNDIQCLHCWKRDGCERLCIHEISTARVTNAVQEMLKEEQA